MRVASILSGIAAVTAFTMFGADTDVQRLKTQVDTLESRIKQLEDRVDTLDKQAQPAKEQAAAVDQKNTAGSMDGWKRPSNWSKVQKGMKPDDVRGLLGIPTLKKYALTEETWYYEGELENTTPVKGYVRFSFGKVSLVTAPDFR
jgi:outer membrane murein-binding lipoprotein Lpp